MNSPSALELKSILRPTNDKLHPITLGNIVARITALFKPENSVRSSAKRGFLLGEVVHHGRFGNGRVISSMPDGRLMIKFNGTSKSLLIFPTLLSRSNYDLR